ncbi:hypothetical protein FWK35_00010163, partial [Aphis craccivora]
MVTGPSRLVLGHTVSGRSMGLACRLVQRGMLVLLGMQVLLGML